MLQSKCLGYLKMYIFTSGTTTLGRVNMRIIISVQLDTALVRARIIKNKKKSLFQSQALWELRLTMQTWPSPRTTPHTTSPTNGTEMASRNPVTKIQIS